MNKLKARNGRVYCDMCNQSFLDEAACKPFLKDGETVVDCIKRNQNDVSMVLRLLAKEKARVAELEAALENILRAMPPTTVYIGYACNQYHATYAAHGSDPFKEARVAIAKAEGE